MRERAGVGNAGVRLAASALALPAGAALQLQQPVLWPVTHYALWAAGALGLGLALWRFRWRSIVLPLVLAALAFSAAGLRAQARLADALPAALEGVDLVVTGTVAELPRRLPEGIGFVFEVEHASTPDGAPVAVPRRVALGWFGGWQGDEVLLQRPYDALGAGQRWRLPVRLKRPHGSLNPHGFDHELWMFEQGLRAGGQVRATERAPALLLDARAGAPVERLRQHVRDAIEARIPDARAAGVLAALAIGDQSAIERSDWELFRDSGIAHLVSISGLHVTMFAWLAAGLIGAAWRLVPRAMHLLPAPTAARWGGLACATAYALMAGWGVPAQRTVWMLATAALLSQGGLRWPWPLVLMAVAAVVAAIDPWALLQPGFWLSFAAVGLLLMAGPGAPAPPVDSGRFARVRHALRHGLRTQVVATLGLAPLTLVFFQQLSLVGFAANLVAIPVVTLLITPLALLGVLTAPLWQLGAWAVQGLVALLGWLVALPGAVWTAAVAPWWMQAAALAGALLLVMRLPWPMRALGFAMMVPLAWPPVQRPADGSFEVLAADVGQGSAVLVRTRSHALLHDAGALYSRDSDAGTRVLVPLLRAIGVARLDLMMLSHRDSDHVGGAAAVLAALPVGALSSSLEPGHALLAGDRPQTRCEAGQRWHWDGVEFRVLHPRAEDYVGAATRKPNTLSCVLSVTDRQGRRALLTGDLEAEQELRLVGGEPAALRSDVLMVPHHGSSTSSTPGFLEAVAPRIALVQAGYRNRFGHPTPEVVARYAERAIVLHDTVHCGAWSAASDSPLARCEREARRRYWHHGLEVARSAGTVEEREIPWRSMSR